MTRVILWDVNQVSVVVNHVNIIFEPHRIIET